VYQVVKPKTCITLSHNSIGRALTSCRNPYFKNHIRSTLLIDSGLRKIQTYSENQKCTEESKKHINFSISNRQPIRINFIISTFPDYRRITSTLWFSLSDSYSCYSKSRFQQTEALRHLAFSFYICRSWTTLLLPVPLCTDSLKTFQYCHMKLTILKRCITPCKTVMFSIYSD
jgi:hypothetical protein